MKPTVRILMVEDSDADARLLLCELARADYEIAAVRVDTAEALQHALTEGGWDLVCCDFTMPRFNGKAALQIVKRSAPDLPFIFVSGTIGEEVAVEAVKAGADDYVMKHNLARLASAVERELRAAARRRECQRLEADRRRLLDELQAALAEVSHLHGLLPICAHCKRIRDDHGYWQEVEHYIQKHSVARFSHSLCPECLDRIYSDAGVEDRLRE